MRRGGRQRCCAARRPCTARYPGTMPQPWCAPWHLSLCHNQVPMDNTKPSSSKASSLGAWVEGLGNARVRSSSAPCHITLPVLPHAHFLSRTLVSESLPLYIPHFALTTGAPPPASALGSMQTAPLPALLINTPPNRQEQTQPAAPFPSNPLPFPSIIYLNIKMSLSLIYMRKKGCNNEDVD